jgi:hypothetical protein
MSETLAKEVAPLGIGVTPVAPGAFRTDFRGPASIKQSATRIDDYSDTAGKSGAGTQAGYSQQAGDPMRGARAIITARRGGAAPRPPADRRRRAGSAPRQARRVAPGNRRLGGADAQHRLPVQRHSLSQDRHAASFGGSSVVPRNR